MRFLGMLACLFLAACGGGGGGYLVPPIEPDPSGIVWSEYRGAVKVPERAGWIKGWVAGPRHAVVASHSNPAPGARIYVIDREEAKVERVIDKVTVLEVDAPIDKTDATLVRFSEPWPATVTINEIADRRPLAWRVTHKDGTHSLRRAAKVPPGVPVLAGQQAERPLLQGSSGLPWFDGRGRVVGQTRKVHYGGSGPDLTDERLRTLIQTLIDEP